jgi:hypothetical protein
MPLFPVDLDDRADNLPKTIAELYYPPRLLQ